MEMIQIFVFCLFALISTSTQVTLNTTDDSMLSVNSTVNFGSSPFATSGIDNFALFKFGTPPGGSFSTLSITLKTCTTQTCGANFPTTNATTIYIDVGTFSWSESTLTWNLIGNTFANGLSQVGSANLTGVPGETVTFNLPRGNLNFYGDNFAWSFLVETNYGEVVSFQTKESTGGTPAKLTYTTTNAPSSGTAYGYSWSDKCGATFINVSNFTQVLGGDEDDETGEIPWPFDFTLFNKTTSQDVDSIWACSNGQLNWADECDYALNILLISPDANLVLVGNDLQTPVNGTGIRYGISGVSPNRILVVDYAVQLLGAAASSAIRLQVHLFETTHQINYVFGGAPYIMSYTFLRNPDNASQTIMYRDLTTVTPGAPFGLCFIRNGTVPTVAPTPTPTPSPTPKVASNVGPDSNNNILYDSSVGCPNSIVDISLGPTVANSMQMPFNFTFYGVVYEEGSDLYVCENGFVSFNRSTECDPFYVPNVYDPNFGHIGFHNPTSYRRNFPWVKVDGVAPNRTLTIQYFIADFTAINIANFQIQLIEAGSEIRLNAMSLDYGLYPWTIWIQNPSNPSDYLTYANKVQMTSLPNTPFTVCGGNRNSIPTPPPTPAPTPIPTPAPTPSSPTTGGNTDTMDGGFEQMVPLMALILIALFFTSF